MGRSLWYAFAAGIAAFAVGVGPAGADPTDISITEVPDVVDAAVTLATAIDPLAVDAAVTEEQLAAAGIISVSTLSLHSPALVVDDDLAQCPNADFTTADGIQQAIVAAPPGATIRVCPGTYHPINVFKQLTLQAPRHQGQATQCQAPFPADPTREAIVEGDNIVATVQISASGVVFEGFTVQDNSAGAGIYTVPTGSGYVLRHNVVQDSVFGLYFNSNGVEESVAELNCFRANIRPGAANGNGVYSDQGLHNARIEENFFTGHFNAAIVLTGVVAATDDIRITHNESIDDSSIALFEVSDVTVDYNKVLRSNGSAIFLGGGVGPGEIAFNVLADGTGTGISLRSDIGVSGDPNRDLVIKSNKITGFGGSGVRLGVGATSNTLLTNRSHRNGIDGIRAATGSSLNTIENNHMQFNVEHDCHDDTVGPGTAGTANFWIRDIGKTENRPGLCKNATVT